VPTDDDLNVVASRHASGAHALGGYVREAGGGTVGDYDMRASAAYIRNPVGSPQLRGLQRRELAVPLLGATKAPVAAPAPAALEESGATAAPKAILYGFINTIVVTPVMIGFCAIIFRHEAFHRDPTVYAQLVKLCLFSSAVHQAVFTATSSLPFAIGQVQDAGLIFLSKMACDLANEMEHEPPEALLSTVLVTLSASTALLGLALVMHGRSISRIRADEIKRAGHWGRGIQLYRQSLHQKGPLVVGNRTNLQLYRR